MIRRIVGGILFFFLGFTAHAAAEAPQVYPYAISICSVIINEMSEGRVSLDEAKQVAFAIARAGNQHFGRVTTGHMWLYMAIVYVESGFRNKIINAYDCRGMFQVHAPSWRGKFGARYTDLLDLNTNAHCGVGIFKYYLDLYKRVVPALSAYNSDDPYAAQGYAMAVLAARKRIMKRYTQLYRVVHEGNNLAIHPSAGYRVKLCESDRMQ
jgi:hypothetical protein